MASHKADLIDRARAELEAATEALSGLAQKRERILLVGDFEAVSALDGDINRQGRIVRAHSDRLRLLELQAEREERARQAKELRGLVDRLNRKLNARDKLASELETTLGQAVRLFHQIYELGNEIAAAAPIRVSDLEPALLTAASLRRMVAAELFRLSGRQFIGGGHIDHGPPDFPGAKADIFVDPPTMTPLGAGIAEASAYCAGRLHEALLATTKPKGAAA